MFKQLSVFETEELAKKSKPLANYVRFQPEGYAELLNWYSHNNLTTRNTLQEHIDKLINLLQRVPNYEKKYESKTYVWGFNWELPQNNFIVYYSNRGLVIEIDPKFRKSSIIPLVTALSDLLLKTQLA
jgi:hypothetical protein